MTFASPARVRFVVPEATEAGRSRAPRRRLPGETVFLEVAEVVATGVHCVDNPVVAPDGTIYATCSGSRGQQTPVSIYAIPPGGVREIFATGMTNATSLAFDPEGRLHVTSRFDGTVSRVDAKAGRRSWRATSAWRPGWCSRHDGTLFVGDRTGTDLQDRAWRGHRGSRRRLPPSVAAFHLALAADGPRCTSPGPRWRPATPSTASRRMGR